MGTPKNSLVKQFQKLFEMDNVKLSFQKEALLSIANYSIKKKTGARVLRSIIEERLLDIMFKLPDIKFLEKVIINMDVINGKMAPIQVHIDSKIDNISIASS